MRPQFDDFDKVLLTNRINERDKIEGPRVGDFLKMPSGEYLRFTHDWGTDIQTTVSRGPNGNAAFNGGFYFCKGGDVSYSGSLDPSLPKDCMRLTEEVKEGLFWFFHHDYAQAHSGVDCMAPCRVFELVVK